MEPWQTFAVVGLLLGIAELFTPTFFSLPAGLAFLATALVGVFTDHWMTLYVVLAINLAMVYGVFYKFVWPRLAKVAPKTNADAMAGKIATVTEAVDPATDEGEVKLYGDKFRVVAKDTFAVGTKVMITATEGNRVLIRALAEGET